MKLRVFGHKLLFSLMITLYGALMWGVNIMYFWKWFIMPAINQVLPNLTVEQIGFIPAVGLYLFMWVARTDHSSTFKYEMIISPDKKDADYARAHTYSVILTPLIVLFVGILINFVS